MSLKNTCFVRAPGSKEEKDGKWHICRAEINKYFHFWLTFFGTEGDSMFLHIVCHLFLYIKNFIKRDMVAD